MKKNLFVLSGLIVDMLLIAACHQPQAAKETSDYTLSGDTILVTANATLAGKLKSGTVKEQSYRLQLLTAGTVKAIPTQYAEIAPPFSGRITRSYLKLGMQTNPETPLFEVSSPDFITAQKIFFSGKITVTAIRKNAETSAGSDGTWRGYAKRP